MSSHVAFRSATEHDSPAIKRYVEQLYASDPGQEPVQPDFARTFNEFQRHADKGRVVAFEMDNRIIGYAIIVFFWSNEFGGNVLDIDEIFVDAAYRTKGVAKQFFNWLEAEFSDAVAWSLEVSAANVAATELCHRADFKPSRNQHLVKRLR